MLSLPPLLFALRLALLVFMPFIRDFRSTVACPLFSEFIFSLVYPSFNYLLSASPPDWYPGSYYFYLLSLSLAAWSIFICLATDHQRAPGPPLSLSFLLYPFLQLIQNYFPSLWRLLLKMAIGNVGLVIYLLTLDPFVDSSGFIFHTNNTLPRT